MKAVSAPDRRRDSSTCSFDESSDFFTYIPSTTTEEDNNNREKCNRNKWLQVWVDDSRKLKLICEFYRDISEKQSPHSRRSNFSIEDLTSYQNGFLRLLVLEAATAVEAPTLYLTGLRAHKTSVTIHFSSRKRSHLRQLETLSCFRSDRDNIFSATLPPCIVWGMISRVRSIEPLGDQVRISL